MSADLEVWPDTLPLPRVEGYALSAQPNTLRTELEAGARLIDRLIPDPAEREKAKLALLQAGRSLAASSASGGPPRCSRQPRTCPSYSTLYRKACGGCLVLALGYTGARSFDKRRGSPR
jgi:hypothetical protein